MRYLLAGVLVVVAAGTSRADEVRLGMNQGEVNQAIGAQALSVALSADGTFGKVWILSDWAGGRRHTFVAFDRNGLVIGWNAYYEPFAVQPAWLVRLRDAFAPTPK